jgi:hypothetical protein
MLKPPAAGARPAASSEARKALQALAKVVAEQVKYRKFGTATAAPSRHDLTAALERIASAIQDVPAEAAQPESIMKAIADGLQDGNADQAITATARYALLEHHTFATWRANLTRRLCPAEVAPQSTTIFSKLGPDLVKLCTAARQSSADSTTAKHEAYTTALNAMQSLQSQWHSICADYPSFQLQLNVMAHQLLSMAKGPSGIELPQEPTECMEKFSTYIQQCQLVTTPMSFYPPLEMAHFANLLLPPGSPSNQPPAGGAPQQPRGKQPAHPTGRPQRPPQARPQTIVRYFTYEVAPDGKIISYPVCGHCGQAHMYKDCNRRSEPRQTPPAHAVTEDQLRDIRNQRRATPAQPSAAPAGKAPPAPGNPGPGNP